MNETSPGTVYLDGVRHTFEAGQVFEIPHGCSLTITPKLYHRFWAKDGGGRAGRRRDLDDLGAQDRQPLRRQRAPLRAHRRRRGAALPAQHRLSAAARDASDHAAGSKAARRSSPAAPPASARRSRSRSSAKVRASSSPIATSRRRPRRRLRSATRAAAARSRRHAARRRCRRWRATRCARFGRIDILVNNAGIMRKAYVKDMTEATVGRGGRRQPQGDVPVQQGGAAGDDRGGARPHHQHRVDRRQGRRAHGERVQRREVRRDRLHALARARGRAARHPRQRDLPGPDSDGARPAGLAATAPTCRAWGSTRSWRASTRARRSAGSARSSRWRAWRLFIASDDCDFTTGVGVQRRRRHRDDLSAAPAASAAQPEATAANGQRIRNVRTYCSS